MPSLFASAWSADNWRVLFRSSTWRRAGYSVRRARRDRRARRYLGEMLLRVSVPLCVVLVFGFLGLLFVATVRAGGEMAVPAVLPVFGIGAGLVFRSLIRAFRPYSNPGKGDERLCIEERRAIRTFFSQLALVFSVLAVRAGSEVYLREKELPKNLEVVSRRRHRDLLISFSLWDKLTPPEREALMMPDGSWDWSLIQQAASMQEQLRLIRWILRMDFFLPALEDQPRFDADLSRKMLKAPQEVFEGDWLIDSKALESARMMAQRLYARCAAEEVVRGYREPESDEAGQWAQEFCAKFGGRQSEDFVFGPEIVSDLPEEELRRATMLAGRRVAFLHWAGEVLEGKSPPQRS